jgi:hypothetical protein
VEAVQGDVLAGQPAAARLEKLAEPKLRKWLVSDPSPEVRRRIESLLNKLRGPVTFPETVRLLRTIEVLEHAPTSEARKVLSDLASGMPGARLTQEAKAAVKRLKRVPAAKAEN